MPDTIQRLQKQIEYLYAQIKCLKDDVTFQDTALDFDTVTKILTSTYADGSTQTTVIPSPTNTSDLVNDGEGAGQPFITILDVPEVGTYTIDLVAQELKLYRNLVEVDSVDLSVLFNERTCEEIVECIDDHLGNTDWKTQRADEEICLLLRAALVTGPHAGVQVIYNEETCTFNLIVTGETFTTELLEKLEAIAAGAQVNSVLSVQGAIGHVILTADDIPLDTTNFANNLSPADDTLQKALDTLDDLVAGLGGTTHGSLSGLANDDHTQYHTDARGDIRYFTQAQINAFLLLKSDVGHTHVIADITDYVDPSLSVSDQALGVNDREITMSTGSLIIKGATAEYEFSEDDVLFSTATNDVIRSQGIAGFIVFGDSANKTSTLTGTSLTLNASTGNINLITSIAAALVLPTASGVAAQVSSPVEGMIKFDTTTKQFLGYDDTSWIDLGASGGGGGASQLSDLSDVNTSTPTNRNVLVADGTDWESRPLVIADISDYVGGSLSEADQSITENRIINLGVGDTLRVEYDLNSNFFNEFSESGVTIDYGSGLGSLLFRAQTVSLGSADEINIGQFSVELGNNTSKFVTMKSSQLSTVSSNLKYIAVGGAGYEFGEQEATTGIPPFVFKSGSTSNAVRNMTFEDANVAGTYDYVIPAKSGTFAMLSDITGGGHIIQDEGTPLTARQNLNFVGAGVTVTDDAGNNTTIVTISGGGAGGATQLSELSDVNTSTPTSGFVLIADGTDFESRALLLADVSDYSDPSLSAVNQTLSTQRDIILEVSSELRIINDTGVNALNYTFRTDGITLTNTSSNFTANFSAINFMAAGKTVIDALANNINFGDYTEGTIVRGDSVTLETSNSRFNVFDNGEFRFSRGSNTDLPTFDIRSDNNAKVRQLTFSDGAGTNTYNIRQGSGNEEIAFLSDISGGGGASQLSDLSDVNTSTPTNRNVLVADGVDWESRALVLADISDYVAPDTKHVIEDNGTPVTNRDNLNFVGATITDDAGNNATVITIPNGGGTNYFSSILAPQLFNPDAAAVIANTDTYTLLNSNAIAFVSINGQVLDDSEYSLVGSDLTITPDNGFFATDDEVLVFQQSFSSVDGNTNNFTQQSANYTVLNTDYYIEATANSFTITMPTAVGIAGQAFVIKNSGAGIVTIDGNGAETIDGSTTTTLNSQYESVKLVSNGVNWLIIT